MNTLLSLPFALPRPEDLCITFARNVGTFLAPALDPLHTTANRVFGILFPFTTAFWQNEVVPLRSPLALQLPLMDPFYIALIVILYLFSVKIGQGIMRNTAPLNVKRFSLWHNMTMVALSTYMSVMAVVQAYRAGYSLFGNKVDHSESGLAMAKIIWLFMFSKIPEFIDTAIMVVKKNNRQITFLHLYHHSSVLVTVWSAILFVPTGEFYFPTFLNSLVHVVMYSYYGFSALGFKQVSFIKNYITIFQITQFCILLVQHTYDVITFRRSGYNGYSIYSIVGGMLYLCSMLGLFLHFLISTNTAKAKATKAAALAAKKVNHTDDFNHKNKYQEHKNEKQNLEGALKE